MKKRIQMLVVFVMMLLAMPSASYACSCVPVPPVQEELQRSDAVFAGKVVEITEQKQPDGYITKAVRFEVTDTWKGVSQSQVIITTGMGGGDCGYEFITGKDYLVYASKSNMYGEETLVTVICDRTRELSAAGEDLGVLGAGKAPTEKVDLQPKNETTTPYVWLGAIGVLAVAAALVARSWRKK